MKLRSRLLFFVTSQTLCYLQMCCGTLENGDVNQASELPLNVKLGNCSLLPDNSIRISWCDLHKFNVKSKTEFHVLVEVNDILNNTIVRRHAFKTRKCEETIENLDNGRENSVHFSVSNQGTYECTVPPGHRQKQVGVDEELDQHSVFQKPVKRNSVIKDRVQLRKQIGNIEIQASKSAFRARNKRSSASNIVVPPGPPGSIKASPVDSKSINVSWTEPEERKDAVGFYLLEWTWDGNRHGSHSPDGRERSYTLSRLVPYKDHSLSLKACLEIDDKALCGENVTTSARTHSAEPSIVKSLQVKEKTNSTIEVTWEQPDVSNGPLDGYVVVFTSNRMIIIPARYEVWGSETTSLKAEGLKPCTKYTITVRAFNNGTDGKKLEGKDQVTNAETGVEVPGPVQILEAVEINKRSVKVGWEGPDSKYCSVDGYTVRIAQSGGGTRKPLTRDTTNLWWKEESLAPWTEYEFSVKAYNIDTANNGARLESAEMKTRVTTLVDAPGVVKSLKVTEKTNTTIKVTWEPPDVSNGPLDGYLVAFTLDTKNLEPRRFDVWGSKNTSLKAESLKPCTKFNVTVGAFNNGTDGNKLVGQVQVTHAETGVEAPGPVKISKPVEIDKRSIRVGWEEPVFKYCAVDGYTVHITQIGGGTGVPLTRDTSEIWWKEDNLAPWTDYEFSIKAYSTDTSNNGVRLTSAENKTSVRTYADAPGDAPKLRSDRQVVTSRNIKVQWDEPKVKNGPLDGYIVRVTPSGGRGENPVGTDTKNTWWEENDLVPWTNYTVSVWAYNIDSLDKKTKLTSASDSVIIETLQDPDLPEGSLKKPDKEINEVTAPERMQEIILDQSLVSQEYSQKEIIVLVSGMGGMKRGADRGTGSLAESKLPAYKKSDPTAFYRASPENWYPFPTSSEEVSIEPDGFPCNYSSAERASICTLGTQDKCEEKKGDFCNGALKPDTEYMVKVRVYSGNGWAETEALILKTARARDENNEKEKAADLGLILGLVFGALGLIVVLVVAVLVYRKRKLSS